MGPEDRIRVPPSGTWTGYATGGTPLAVSRMRTFLFLSLSTVNRTTGYFVLTTNGSHFGMTCPMFKLHSHRAKAIFDFAPIVHKRSRKRRRFRVITIPSYESMQSVQSDFALARFEWTLTVDYRTNVAK